MVLSLLVVLSVFIVVSVELMFSHVCSQESRT